ncbi:MAG TPA: nucleotidyl transferase AbiEii/AbiGii toxin family protein [Stenomitos sp.]
MNQPRNVAASVRQRLLDLSRQRGEEFQGLLTRYALERLLYRLGESEYRDRFILKGAMLFSAWSNEPHRATRDLDLLGFGDNSIAHLEQVFRDICCVQVEPDGLEFKDDTVSGQRIKEDQEYEGVRIELMALLGVARIPIQIDIGFGDALANQPQELSKFPTMLDLPAPRVRTYPRETVVAEKFQAMVVLGIANSRMKDFYDLWFLCQKFEFEGEALSLAIKATFERRHTSVPHVPPLALTPEFSLDGAKQAQWRAFLRKGKLKAEGLTLKEAIEVLDNFLMPPSRAVANGEPFGQVWPPTGLWQVSSTTILW